MAYKFNPFTGNFDLTNEDVKNFSLKVIASPEEIPATQQMAVVGGIKILSELSVKGELVLFGPQNKRPRAEIASHEFARVEVSELFYLDSIKIQGHLKLKGSLRIGSPVMDSTTPHFIDTFEQYRINQNRRALVSGDMKVHGSLKVKGQLKII